jgi:AcrR family transcriptional regulator
VTTQRSGLKKGGSRPAGAATAARKSAGKKPAREPETAPGNRQKILATALWLFTEFGVDATPTARISKEAGVSTGTLFHYFPDKDTLVAALYVSIKKEMAASARDGDDPSLPTKKRIEKAIRGFILWGVANPLKVRFIDQCYSYPGIGEDVHEQIHNELAWMAGLVHSAIREGLLPDLPFEFHGTMLYQIISGILALIGSGASGMSNDEIIENGLAMLWKWRED